MKPAKSATITRVTGSRVLTSVKGFVKKKKKKTVKKKAEEKSRKGSQPQAIKAVL